MRLGVGTWVMAVNRGCVGWMVEVVAAIQPPGVYGEATADLPWVVGCRRSGIVAQVPGCR